MGRSGGGGGGFSSGGHGGGSHHGASFSGGGGSFRAVVHAEAVLAVVQGLTVPVRDLDHTTITVRGHITIMRSGHATTSTTEKKILWRQNNLRIFKRQ